MFNHTEGNEVAVGEQHHTTDQTFALRFLRGLKHNDRITTDLGNKKKLEEINHFQGSSLPELLV